MTLSEIAALIARLDKARTPGIWHGKAVTPHKSTALYLQADSKTIADFRYSNGEADMAFVIAVPLMASVIAEQRHRLQFAITVFEGMMRFSPHEEVRKAAAAALERLQDESLRPGEVTH